MWPDGVEVVEKHVITSYECREILLKFVMIMIMIIIIISRSKPCIVKVSSRLLAIDW